MKWWPWRRATRRVTEPAAGAPRPTGQWRSLPPLPATVSTDAPLTVPAVPPSVLDRLTLPEPARPHRGAPVGRVLGIVTAVPDSGPAVRHAALPVHRRAEHRFTADEDVRPRSLPARSGEVPETPVTVAAPRWTAPPTAPATPWTPSEFLHRAYAEQDRLLAQNYLETNGEAQPPPPVTHTPEEPAYTAPVTPPAPEPPAPRPRRASLAQARRQGLTLGQTPTAASEPSAPAGPADQPAAAGSPDEPRPVAGTEERTGPRRESDPGPPEEPPTAGDEEIAHGTRPAWRETADEAPRPAGPEVLARDARRDVTSGTSRVTRPDVPGDERRAVSGEVARGTPLVDRREVARGVGAEVSPGVVDVASVSGVRGVVGGEVSPGVVDVAPVSGAREVVRAEVAGVVGAASVPGVRDEGAPGFVDVAPVPTGGDVVGAAGVEVSLGVVDVASVSGVRGEVASGVAAVPGGREVVAAAGFEVSPGVVGAASVSGVRDEGAPGFVDVAPVPTGGDVVGAAGVEVSLGVVDVVPVSGVREVVGAEVAGVVDVVPVSGVRDVVGDEAAPGVVDVARVPTGRDVVGAVADEVSRGVGGVASLGERDVVRSAGRVALNRAPRSAEREARREVPRAVRPDDPGGAEPRATPGVVDVTPLPADRRGVRNPGRQVRDEVMDVTPRSWGRQATQSVPDTRGEAAQGASREVVDEAPTSVTREDPQEMEMPSPPERNDAPHGTRREVVDVVPVSVARVVPRDPGVAARGGERAPRQETPHATPWTAHRDVHRPEPPRGVPIAGATDEPAIPPDLVSPTVSSPVPSSRAQFATGDGSSAGESGSDGREADLRAPLSVAGPVALAVGVDVWDVPVRRGRDVTALSHRLGVRGYTDDNVVYLPDDVGPLDGAVAAPLLAHELTHAAQQRRLGSALPAPGSLAAARLEQDAENVERWVAGGATGAPPPLAHPLDAATPPPASGGGRQYRMADVLTDLSASAVGTPRLDVRTTVPDGVPVGRGDVPGADSPPPLDVSSLFGPAPAEPGPGTGEDGPGDGTASGRPSGEFDEETIATLAEAIADIYAVDPPRRWFDLDDVDDFEELAGRIHQELMSRLRLDMVVDRERSGTLLDFG